MSTIDAYDLPERVSRYDADMDIMHPNRHKMIATALDVIPFEKCDSLTAVDLGTGTGLFCSRFLQAFPMSTVVAVDGAAAMLELAKTRLGALSEKVRFVSGDFRSFAELLPGLQDIDIVFSSYALHHLTSKEKENVIRECMHVMRPGGWFINADIVASNSSDMETRIQEIRVNGILERTFDTDMRFKDAISTRAFLNELEARDGDMPLPLNEDLAIAKRAGMTKLDVFWKEYREVVWGGSK